MINLSKRLSIEIEGDKYCGNYKVDKIIENKNILLGIVFLETQKDEENSIIKRIEKIIGDSLDKNCIITKKSYAE